MAGFNEFKYVTEAQRKIREAQTSKDLNNNELRNIINELKKYLVEGLRTNYPDTYKELKTTITNLEKTLERGI